MNTPVPPRLAEWLVRRIAPRGDRDVVLGDLHESFGRVALSEGPAAARRWYWQQTLTSCAALARRRRPLRLARLARPSTQRSSMSGLWQDIRFTLRTAIRRPMVTTVAVLSLTLGIAMTTVVFSLMDAVLLRPLAVEAPSELALITEQRTSSINYTLPYPDFVDWNAGQRAFSALFASSRMQVSMRSGGEARIVTGEMVSGSYFPTLGVRARAGRVVGTDDDRAGAAPVVVVSATLWDRIAGPGAAFVPTPVTINDIPFTVVGVAPRRFGGIHIGTRADAWIPFSAMAVADPDVVAGDLTERRSSWLWIMGRRLPGVTNEAAAADLNRVEAGLAPTVGRTAPKQLRVTDGLRGTDRVPDATAETLQILLVAGGLVLLIACANVANLLLARSADRRRELQVRAALGAGRWRLVRLLTTDSLLTAVSAGVLGVLVAWPISRLAVSLIAVFGTPMELVIDLDWRMAAFGLALGMASAMLASLAPAVHVLQSFGASAGDAGTRSASAGRTALRLRQSMLVAQFALALALVVSAGLLLRTVGNLRAMPTGFEADRLALLTVDTAVTGFTGPQAHAYINEATRRLSEVPGVAAVGFARVIPLGFGGARRTVGIPGYTPAPDEDMELNYNDVTGDYFAAMDIDIIAGRPLTTSDIGAPVAVVNETMAQRYFPGGDAVGRTMQAGGPDLTTIVGVARDVKYRMLREAPRPSFYVPLSARSVRGGTFHIRTSPQPDTLLPSMRQAVTSADPQVPVTVLRTMRAQSDANINDDRVAMFIGLALAGAALILSAVGLFGSMTYLVTQRTRELGIRVALGADATRIHRLVIRQGLQLACVGAVLGAVLSFWTTRAIEARLFGVTPLDPVAFGAAALALTGVALIASFLPARRAARVDPIRALHTE
jgi:predicted permease